MGLVYAEGKYTSAHRHPRCRGRLRRHGLQGRRDLRRGHRPPARHQDRGHPVRRAGPGPATRPRTPVMQILDVMSGAIGAPARRRARRCAPKIVSFEIPVDKIGEVIGPKGKVINSIQTETGADISVDDDGVTGIVSIASSNREGGGRRGRAPDPSSSSIRPTADVGADLRRPGGQHHQVRCLRQHPPRPRWPAPHLQDRGRQADRQGRGRARSRPGGRRGVSRTSTPTARSAWSRPMPLPSTRQPATLVVTAAMPGAIRAQATRALTATAAARPRRSRTTSSRSWSPITATWALPRSAEVATTTVAAAVAVEVAVDAAEAVGGDADHR